jgi:hypothetical protein
MMDVNQVMRDEEMLAEIEDVLEGFNRPRHAGQWGPCGYVVRPAWLEWRR